METILDLVTKLSLADRKTLSQKALKLQEECGELAKAVLPYEGAHACNHRFPTLNKITEECADVLLVAYSIAASLGVTKEQLMATVHNKALYWQSLQEAEDATDMTNLMFEMHVTVAAIDDLDTFRQDCAEMGVKPIILDLYTKGEPILDVMTSSHMTGTTTQAAIYSKGLVAELERRGYTVLREKIETVPWHPASMNAHNRPAPSRYFEAHLAFHPASDKDHNFEPFLKKHRIKLSRNKMKKGDNVVLMGTYRRTSIETNVTAFRDELNEMMTEARNVGLEVIEKPITEFALFDTNDRHDKEWIG